MKIPAAEIADAPPRGSILTRPTGKRLAGADVTEDRCITFIASDSSCGRDMHVIRADAWDTKNFLQNPVCLFAHDDQAPPVGRVISLRTVGDQLRAIVKFAEAETYDFADTIFRLLRGGYLNAVSTGWLPRAWKAANDRNRPGGLDFTDVELLEISVVPVPALPTALATARAAGVNLAPLAAWAETQLDGRGRLYSERDLVMIRNAAGPARSYAAPRPSPYLPRIAKPGADPASGFRSLGEYLLTVARASTVGSTADRRLTRAPTGLGEVDPSKGGFLVPPTYVDHLIESIYEESVIAPWCEQFDTDRPTDASIPGVDESSRADGSRWGGATGYWAEEAQAVTTSLAKWRKVKFSGHKLMAACIATKELLADAAMLEAYVKKAFSAELSFKLDAAILRGNGIGVPLGVLNSPALITVSKSNGQQAQTIISENVEGMWQRLPTPCRRRAVWLINEDVEQQLSLVNSGTLNPTGAALYVAAGVAGNETPLLKGRPVIVNEQAPALGTPGDIVLADLSQYALVGAPLKTDLSLDVMFSTDQAAFRFVWRIDGKPLWSSAVTPYNATATRSPFVALAQR